MLPSHLKNSNVSREQFKSGLKTWLRTSEAPLRTLFKRRFTNTANIFDWLIAWLIDWCARKCWQLVLFGGLSQRYQQSKVFLLLGAFAYIGWRPGYIETIFHLLSYQGRFARGLCPERLLSGGFCRGSLCPTPAIGIRHRFVSNGNWRWQIRRRLAALWLVE